MLGIVLKYLGTCRLCDYWPQYVMLLYQRVLVAMPGSHDLIIPNVTCQLCSVLGMELIWDTYKDDYLKGTARAKGGKGVTRCVDRKDAIPGNWQNSIWVDCNKTEHPGPM